MEMSSPGHVDGRRRAAAVWWHSRFGRNLLIEFALVTGLLMLYRRVRLVTQDDLAGAFRNAREVLHFESWLGLPFEDDLQRLLLSEPTVVKALNHYYVFLHFPVAVGLLLWLFARHYDVYRPTRTLMAIVTFAGLALHLAYPLAPPRMMPGFVDTMFRYGPQIYQRNALEGAANQFAAMPSLHFGWAVIAAMAVVRAWSTPWRWLIVLHPVLMALAIMGTANHWWVDGAAAGVLIALCWAAGKLFTGLRVQRRDRRALDDDALAEAGRGQVMVEAIDDRTLAMSNEAADDSMSVSA